MTEPRKGRVLISCVGGTLAPDLLLQLRSESDLVSRLIGVDACEDASGFRYADAFYRVPWADDPTYVDAVVEIVRREGVNCIFPGSDQEAFVFARARERFLGEGAVVMTSPASVLELIKDKEATYSTVETAGVRVPRRNNVSSVAELKSALEKFGYPERSVVCKPTGGRGGRGLRILAGADGLGAFLGSGAREEKYEAQPDDSVLAGWLADGTLMVMPPLGAPAYDVDILAVKGKARHAIVRQRVNPAGIPFAGNIVLPDAGIREYCLAIAEAIGLDGLHDIDLMTDIDGKPALLEVNPRMSGSAVASHAAGFPIVSAAIAAAIGVDYAIPPVTERVMVNLIPHAAKVVSDAAR